ncbi:FxSxx-COOH cyclophane-containing RiPP peptide [Streptomyces sp. RFCAC02]|uniref:FxSxx-COOH cyclophane-containing RiPP peptide n=1 Tax=Streptomyces sp. RFCAC02 TaxID=2499143 RepID=UPI0010210078|nr:FxSxx-COOH cyclophane-containing RiPP peptide [Streptomyces sp. RFCAC02]
MTTSYRHTAPGTAATGAGAHPPDLPGAPGLSDRSGLPDVLGLSLAELRRLDHPVLSEVLDDLRDRVVRQREGLWGFTQFSQFDQAMPDV